MVGHHRVSEACCTVISFAADEAEAEMRDHVRHSFALPLALMTEVLGLWAQVKARGLGSRV